MLRCLIRGCETDAELCKQGDSHSGAKRMARSQLRVLAQGSSSLPGLDGCKSSFDNSRRLSRDVCVFFAKALCRTEALPFSFHLYSKALLPISCRNAAGIIASALPASQLMRVALVPRISDVLARDKAYLARLLFSAAGDDLRMSSRAFTHDVSLALW